MTLGDRFTPGTIVDVVAFQEIRGVGEIVGLADDLTRYIILLRERDFPPEAWKRILKSRTPWNSGGKSLPLPKEGSLYRVLHPRYIHLKEKIPSRKVQLLPREPLIGTRFRILRRTGHTYRVIDLDPSTSRIKIQSEQSGNMWWTSLKTLRKGYEEL